MTAAIPCKAADGFECPYIQTCLARLTDMTITGCGMALYMNGLIEFNDIGVQHTIRKGKADDMQTNKKAMRMSKVRVQNIRGRKGDDRERGT